MKNPFLKSPAGLRSVLGSVFLAAFVLAPAAFAQTLNITSAPYNASTGSADNAAAIQAAINAVGSGGTVLVPSGTFLSGPITLKSNMTFQIASGGTLKMTAFGTFPQNTSFVYGSGLSNLTINGSGTMDGQGAAWWTDFNNGNPDNRPPAMIYISKSSSVTLMGITVKDSPKFHVQLLGSMNGVYCSGLSITAAWPSPNTDGMDIRGKNYLIENCYISDGDDVIQIGGSDNCQAITIRNCAFGTGHGLSIGGYTQGGVSNILVDSCTFNGTQYGIRWKSGRDRGGTITNLTYSNITMTGILNYPFYLTSWYPNSLPPSSDTAAATTSTTPYWENITLRNITASTASGDKGPGIFWAVPEAPVTNLLFDGVTVTDHTSNTFDIHHARAVTFLCNCRINGAQPPTNVGSFDATIAYPACGPTPTKTNTPAVTATFTFTPTKTNTPVPPTATFTNTWTHTLTATPSSTATRTNTPVPPTNTFTFTSTATATATRTSTPTASSTATRTNTPVPPTATFTSTSTNSSTKTNTPVPPTNTFTLTFTATATATHTNSPAPPTATFTDSTTATASPTLTASPSATPTHTPVPPTATFTNTNSPVPPSATPTFTNTLVLPTATFSSTNSPIPPTATPTNTPVPPTPTFTNTNSPVPPSATPTNTNSPVPPSATPTSTNSPVPPTVTPTRTFTAIFTNSSTNTAVPPTATFSRTNTPTSTFTPTDTFTPTSTRTFTPTDTVTVTPSFTFTPLPLSTFTPTPGTGVQAVIFPNPVTGNSFNIQVTGMTTTDKVQVQIETTAFRLVNELTFHSEGPGTVTLNVPTTDSNGVPLANGVYYVIVRTEGARFTLKLMILH